MDLHSKFTFIWSYSSTNLISLGNTTCSRVKIQAYFSEACWMDEWEGGTLRVMEKEVWEEGGVSEEVGRGRWQGGDGR